MPHKSFWYVRWKKSTRRHFRRRASPKPSLRLEAICGRRRGFLPGPAICWSLFPTPMDPSFEWRNFRQAGRSPFAAFPAHRLGDQLSRFLYENPDLAEPAGSETNRPAQVLGRGDYLKPESDMATKRGQGAPKPHGVSVAPV